MSDPVESIILIILFFALLIAFAIGAIKTFRRNWVAALLLMIFIFPIWAVWAIIELFTGPVVASEVSFGDLGRGGQNVTVTVVNQLGSADGRYEVTEGGPQYEALSGQVKNIQFSKRIESPIEKSEDMKPCPYCAEYIKSEAIYCRYCKKDV